MTVMNEARGRSCPN